VLHPIDLRARGNIQITGPGRFAQMESAQEILLQWVPGNGQSGVLEVLNHF
jgi:hypothetical protein